jgi:hypothetical protein
MDTQHRSAALKAIASVRAHLNDGDSVLAEAQRWLEEHPTDSTLRQSFDVNQRRLIEELSKQVANDFGKINGALASLEHGEPDRPVDEEARRR